MQWDVYLKSVTLCLGLYLVNLALCQGLAHWIHDLSFRRAAAFCLLQLIAIAGLAACLLGRRAYTRFRTGIQEQIRPAMEERVMALALTGETWSTRLPNAGPARHVLEQCLAHALTSVRDSGQDRLAQFASQNGFSAQWQKELASGAPEERQRAVRLLGKVSRVSGATGLRGALDDDLPAIRAEAGRALLVCGDAAAVEQVFRWVLREPLLTRALLTSDLKRHAGYLLAQVIPEVLSKSDRQNNLIDARNCLEFLSVWKLAITSIDIAPLLNQQRAASFLPLVIGLLPYASVPESIEKDLLAALDSEDLELQCAAARASGWMKLRSLMPALARLLDRNRRLAIAAAHALAQMGAEGARQLETIVTGTDRKAAAVALEALELLTVRHSTGEE